MSYCFEPSNPQYIDNCEICDFDDDTKCGNCLTDNNFNWLEVPFEYDDGT